MKGCTASWHRGEIAPTWHWSTLVGVVTRYGWMVRRSNPSGGGDFSDTAQTPVRWETGLFPMVNKEGAWR